MHLEYTEKPATVPVFLCLRFTAVAAYRAMALTTLHTNLGVSGEEALQHASPLMNCANTLTFLGTMPSLLYAA